MASEQAAPELWLWRAEWHRAAWPLYLALGLPLAYGLAFQWPLLIVILSVAAPVLPLFLAALAVKAAGIRRGGRATVAACAVLVLVAQPILPAIFWHPLYKAGLWGGLAPFYGHFKAQVAALPRDKGPRRLVLDLGYAGLVGHGLIFDESDQIATSRRPNEPPIAWLDAAAAPCDGDVVGLGRHYYACIYSVEW